MLFALRTELFGNHKKAKRVAAERIFKLLNYDFSKRLGLSMDSETASAVLNKRYQLSSSKVLSFPGNFSSVQW